MTKLYRSLLVAGILLVAGLAVCVSKDGPHCFPGINCAK